MAATRLALASVLEAGDFLFLRYCRPEEDG
jgi:hypothetical protein